MALVSILNYSPIMGVQSYISFLIGWFSSTFDSPSFYTHAQLNQNNGKKVDRKQV